MNTRSNSSTKQQAMNEVWIELQPPRDAAHAVEIACLANTMMERLAGSKEALAGNRFVWSPTRKQWMHGAMSMRYLTDSGEWFNLDQLGRPIEPTISKAQERLDTLAAERMKLHKALLRLVAVCVGAGWHRNKHDALAEAYAVLGVPDPNPKV